MTDSLEKAFGHLTGQAMSKEMSPAQAIAEATRVLAPLARRSLTERLLIALLGVPMKNVNPASAEFISMMAKTAVSLCDALEQELAKGK